ncbi:hypothetical protein KKHLCK_14495 [Candidatus Electrothrix laxa]
MFFIADMRKNDENNTLNLGGECMDEKRGVTVVEKKDQGKREQKRPYEKPRITAVALFADQVLLGCAKQAPIPICGPGQSS